MSSTYVAGGDPALAYGRYANPVWTSFEEVLGDLEGGRALAFASGMAAVSATLEVLTDRLLAEHAARLGAAILSALTAAHQAGITHRDVKPANVLIGEDDRVVLVDFGVARSLESAALTGAKEVVGTALYIAPEQVSKAETGPPADVYALGAVAYHCLAGHPPFQGESPIAVAIQHEYDHLQGVLMIDHMGPLKKRLTHRKMVKRAEEQSL